MAAATLAVASCRRNETAEVVAPIPTPIETPAASTDAAPAPAATPAPAQPATASAEGTAINPPKTAWLTAEQAGAQINLRSQPNAQSQSKGYGLVGDSVQLLRAAEGGDSLTWYYVKFQGSGAEGWIRGDFINTSE
ncbi:MAG: SH3 domain-containing protein, partial [Cyanobacteria bacterium Co-bin13]|nr:SH3 domain-containing protein [Cyanobacteria bacterium Co-bin13]